MASALRILFVPRWYPSRIDPMPGLFIQRQAEALARIHSVQVISVHPDGDCSRPFEIVDTVEASVKVCRVYYKTLHSNSLSSRLFNLSRYVRAHHHGYMHLMPFKVDVVHGHIFTREIVFAWYMALKQKRPFIVSEHWSRYFSENGTYNGRLRKCLSRFLLKRASGLISVSEPLVRAMSEAGLAHPNTFVVPNVIDISSFIPPVVKRGIGRPVILHVSCFDNRSKNITGFLDAIAELTRRRSDFRVLLAGEGPDFNQMSNYARNLGLDEETVVFTGLQQNAGLISLYQSASFLVQTSFYETFGTVVIEALSCGLPVVSTNTGIAPSVINQGNGIIIQQPSVYEIVRGIAHMLDNYHNFEPSELHESVAGKFSGGNISERLTEIYNEVIKTWQKA